MLMLPTDYVIRKDGYVRQPLIANQHPQSTSANRLNTFLTKFVMRTVAYMTSYHQNIPQPYLIDSGTLQYILPYPAVQSAISSLSIMVGYTISMFS